MSYIYIGRESHVEEVGILYYSDYRRACHSVETWKFHWIHFTIKKPGFIYKYFKWLWWVQILYVVSESRSYLLLTITLYSEPVWLRIGSQEAQTAIKYGFLNLLHAMMLPQGLTGSTNAQTWSSGRQPPDSGLSHATLPVWEKAGDSYNQDVGTPLMWDIGTQSYMHAPSNLCSNAMM